MKKIGLFLVSFFGCVVLVNAASISVTSSSNYATSGGKITFYVNIRDAGAWQLTGSGTGATSGCSLGEQGVGDTGTGRNGNKTLVVSCNATSVGQISFYVSGNVSDASSGKSVDVSGRKIVTVQAPREKDSNNYLKSLGVTGYEITPVFSKDTLEYQVTVPSTVDKVVLEAVAESGYATITGTGEFEVDDGVNTKEISVMSETGVERIYKVKIEVKDENPIQVMMDGKEYTVLKNVKHVEKPELYDATTMKINNFDIPIFVSDITGYTLVALKDSTGDVVLAVFDKDANRYELYQEISSQRLLLNVLKPEKEWEEYEKVSIEIDDMVVDGYRFMEDYVIVYAMNIETGEKDYYLYHEKSQTFQLFRDEVIQRLREEILKSQYLIYGLMGAVGFFFLISLFAIFKRPSKRKWKRIDEPDFGDSMDFVVREMKEEQSNLVSDVLVSTTESETLLDSMIEEKKLSKKERKKLKKKELEVESQEVLERSEPVEEQPLEKEEEKEDILVTQILPTLEEKTEDELSETVDVTVALSKMNDAEEIIREYEKTLSLSREEIKKAQEAEEEKEEKDRLEKQENVLESNSENVLEDNSKKKKRKKRKG